MRKWINLVEDIQKINFDGFWIEPNGTVHKCDHSKKLHHADIALNHFSTGNSQSKHNTKNNREESLTIAMEAGWMRISAIDTMGFTVNWDGTASSSQIMALRKILSKTDTARYDQFYLEHDNNYLNFDNYIRFINVLKTELHQ